MNHLMEFLCLDCEHKFISSKLTKMDFNDMQNKNSFDITCPKCSSNSVIP